MQLSIKEVLNATNGKCISGKSTTVLGVCTDSRTIKKGDLFIPLVGENFDGHDFLQKAIDGGAAAVVIDQKNDLKWENGCVIKVKDTLKALQDLAKFYLSKFSIPVVAVTGSTGKTSTKDMIYTVLSKKYHVLRNKGNFNNHIGLPLTIFELEREYDIAILEMGMSGFGEIHLLADIARPDIGVITNIGISHIEHLKTQENIMKAKMEITDFFSNKSRLIVNGDDQHLKTLKDESLSYEIQFIGKDPYLNYKVTHVHNLGEKGIDFDVSMEDQKYTFHLKVPGEHNIYNALCAIAVGRALNVKTELIQQALCEFEGSHMRLNIITTKKDIKIINDAYNASPDSMKAAIEVLTKIKSHKKICVLGDMLELGSHAKEGHYEVGKRVACSKVDNLITLGEDAEYIAKGAQDHGMNEDHIYICKDHNKVLQVLKDILKTDDAVLIKGSRGMKMEKIVQSIQERRS